MKLYSFKKTSWHVRFFKWIFDVNPVNRYKTMCPYFWTYVLIFLFLPLILLVKMFGTSGTKFLNWTKDYKNNKLAAAISHLKELCGDPNITAETAYKITRSKCWKKHHWEVEYDIKNKVKGLAHKHYDYLDDLKRAKDRASALKQDARSKKYEEVKEQKWFTPVAYTITFSMLGLLIYAIGYMGYQGGKMIDWPWLGKWTLYVLAGAAVLFVAGLIVYGFIKHMVAPFFRWVSCIKLPECGICENMKAFLSLFKYIWRPIRYVLVGIGKFFAIIGDMIYSTYKKKCPIITWED